MNGMMRYAGFGRRLTAFVIDNLLLQITVVIVLILALSFTGDAIDITAYEMIDSLKGVYWATSFVTGLFYFTWFHGMTGQTIGKKILGLKVVRTTGERMTLGIGFLRWVGYIVSSTVFYLGFLWILFDGKKRGWHDRIAGTLVIKTGSTY